MILLQSNRFGSIANYIDSWPFLLIGSNSLYNFKSMLLHQQQQRTSLAPCTASSSGMRVTCRKCTIERKRQNQLVGGTTAAAAATEARGTWRTKY